MLGELAPMAKPGVAQGGVGRGCAEGVGEEGWGTGRASGLGCATLCEEGKGGLLGCAEGVGEEGLLGCAAIAGQAKGAWQDLRSLPARGMGWQDLRSLPAWGKERLVAVAASAD